MKVASDEEVDQKIEIDCEKLVGNKTVYSGALISNIPNATITKAKYSKDKSSIKLALDYNGKTTSASVKRTAEYYEELNLYIAQLNKEYYLVFNASDMDIVDSYTYNRTMSRI